MHVLKHNSSNIFQVNAQIKKIINFNKKFLESIAEQEKVKENLSADVPEKIIKSVFQKNHKFKSKIAPKKC